LSTRAFHSPPALILKFAQPLLTSGARLAWASSSGSMTVLACSRSLMKASESRESMGSFITCAEAALDRVVRPIKSIGIEVRQNFQLMD
jgi:hypothetical protein